MATRWQQYQTFFREFRRNYHTTGAVLPSGAPLARALARYVRERPADAPPRAILEVGPGTGAVTGQIVAALGPADRLDLVELNPSFVEILERRFQREPALARVRERTRILHQSVDALAEPHGYDVVVSGLPLNNFAVADVETLVAALTRNVRPGGTLSFFEYIAIRTFRGLVSGRGDRVRLRGIGRILGELLAGREIRRDWVFRNVPPAWVHHVRCNGAAGEVQNPGQSAGEGTAR